MAYKVLYRKYRPQNFNELYGQDSIKKILIDSIINNKLSHAYLFSGPRGTGKTSTAKLFAKTINCENPKNGIPCDKCNSCLNYEQSPDIIEIDAASNNGVDEIRELRENAKIMPSLSNYKIYIIDEVHMLSQSAWNAFLKILEEPPHHVIFILATTEIQKIPITILSRCQRFSFQRIDSETIIENLKKISKQEKIKITKDALSYIAELADGGMRDALSLLDQLSKENEEITKDLIISTFGLISTNDVEKIFSSLFNSDYNSINDIFNEYKDKGLDSNLLISKLINYIFDLELEVQKGNKKSFTSEELKAIALELSNCYNKQDSLTLVKIILFSYIKETQKQDEIISREIISDKKEEIKKEAKKEKEIPEKTKQKNVEKPDNIGTLVSIRINNSFYKASKEEKTKFKKAWEIFIKKEIEKNNVEILSFIEDANIEVVSETNVLFSQKSSSTAILFNENVKQLESEFKIDSGIDKKFICISDKEWNKEKEKFISNKSKTYEYISEELEDPDEDIVKSAKGLFDDSIIEIK